MHLRILCLLLALISLTASATFSKYTSLRGLTFLGRTTFQNYTPHFALPKHSRLNVFAYPGVPLEPPRNPSYPATIYFGNCEQEKMDDDLTKWLKSLLPEQTLPHFIFYLPCNEAKNYNNYSYSDFVEYWKEYGGISGVDSLKIHILTYQDSAELAFRLIESLPEMFTSLTLVDAVPLFNHPVRYTGLKIRGFTSNRSIYYKLIKSEFEKLKNKGFRSDLIELDVDPKEIVKYSIASRTHWDWVFALQWD